MNILGSTIETGSIRSEVARDLIALGGLPFYFLIIIRTTIGSYHDFLFRLLIALVSLYVLTRLVKDANQHIARGFILLVFTTLHYEDLPFTLFAFIVWLIMIYSLTYLKVTGRQIITGITFGVISSALGYLLTLLIVSS